MPEDNQMYRYIVKDAMDDIQDVADGIRELERITGDPKLAEFQNELRNMRGYLNRMLNVEPTESSELQRSFEVFEQRVYVNPELERAKKRRRCEFLYGTLKESDPEQYENYMRLCMSHEI